MALLEHGFGPAERLPGKAAKGLDATFAFASKPELAAGAQRGSSVLDQGDDGAVAEPVRGPQDGGFIGAGVIGRRAETGNHGPVGVAEILDGGTDGRQGEIGADATQVGAGGVDRPGQPAFPTAEVDYRPLAAGDGLDQRADLPGEAASRCVSRDRHANLFAADLNRAGFGAPEPNTGGRHRTSPTGAGKAHSRGMASRMRTPITAKTMMYLKALPR